MGASRKNVEKLKLDFSKNETYSQKEKIQRLLQQAKNREIELEKKVQKGELIKVVEVDGKTTKIKYEKK